MDSVQPPGNDAWHHDLTAIGILHVDSDGRFCETVSILDLSDDGYIWRDTTLWCDSNEQPHLDMSYWPNAQYVPDPALLARWQAQLQTDEEWAYYDATKDEWPTTRTRADAWQLLQEQIARVGEARTFEDMTEGEA